MLTLSTLYNDRFQRVESVGTFGTIFEYVLLGVAVISTLSISLHTSRKDYSNNYGLNSSNSGAADTITGDFRNQDLQIPLVTAATSPHIFQRSL